MTLLSEINKLVPASKTPKQGRQKLIASRSYSLTFVVTLRDSERSVARQTNLHCRNWLNSSRESATRNDHEGSRIQRGLRAVFAPVYGPVFVRMKNRRRVVQSNSVRRDGIRNKVVEIGGNMWPAKGSTCTWCWLRTYCLSVEPRDPTPTIGHAATVYSNQLKPD